MKLADIALPIKKFMILVVFVSSTSFLVACEKDDGPLEEAGEKMDEAVNDTKRNIEDATD